MPPKGTDTTVLVVLLCAAVCTAVVEAQAVSPTAVQLAPAPALASSPSPAAPQVQSPAPNGVVKYSDDYWNAQVNNLRLAPGVNESLLTPCPADYEPPSVPQTCGGNNFSVGTTVNTSTGKHVQHQSSL